MPLDILGKVKNSDFYHNRNLESRLEFAWLPHTCNLSNKRIWLRYGYKLTAWWRGPGNSISEEMWHDKNTHIMWLLTR